MKGTIAFTSELLGGYQAMAQSLEIRRAVIQGTIFGFFGRALLELFPIMADQLFAKGAAGAGQLMSAAGLGAILSALILVASPRPFRLFEQAIANAAMLFCFLLIAFMTVVESWPLAFGAAIILGFSSSIVGVVNQTAVQKQTEQTYQGRVMGIWTALTLGSPAIGALVYGLIADWLSPSVALMAGSLVGAISTAGFLKFGLFKRG